MTDYYESDGVATVVATPSLKGVRSSSKSDVSPVLQCPNVQRPLQSAQKKLEEQQEECFGPQDCIQNIFRRSCAERATSLQVIEQDNMENTCNHEDCKKFYHRCKQMIPKMGSFGNEEQAMLERIQKRIKKELDAIGSNSERDFQNSGTNPMFLPQMMQFPVKQEFGVPNPPGLFLTFPSQHQSFQQSLNTQIQDSSSSIGMPSINLSNISLSQFINMRNQNNMPETLQKNSMQKLSDESRFEVTGLQADSSVKEFQNKLYNLMLTQNKVLIELKEKHDVLQEALACLIGEVGALKESLQRTGSDPQSIPISSGLISQMMTTSSETANSDTLLSSIYGPNPDFQYQLVLKQDLNLPLYRERNFKFTVMLIDKNGKIVENTNRIPLSLGVYSSENPPKYIETNTAEKDLIYGSASFEKIQIKEVTSHFRSGWVFFVVYPKTNLRGNMITLDSNAKFINSQKIKPLILEKVVVKAKKTKEKEGVMENDDNDDDEVSN